jgi:hypothetical protein
MQRNMKIGERKSDLVCSACDKELSWEGSIMEGKMVCKNPFCGGKVLEFSSGLAEVVTVDKVMERYYFDLYKEHRLWCKSFVMSPCDCGHSINMSPHSWDVIRQLEIIGYGDLT